MSSEAFDRGNISLGRLASDLSKITTRIVMVYRPFYMFIASVYRETHSKNFSSTGFADWLSDEKMEFFADYRFTTAVYSRYAAHFSDIRVHTLGPSLMTDIACDDLNASKTCSWFRKAVVEMSNVRTKGSTAGKCLSLVQAQKLERISIDLHRAAFGILSPHFSTSDFQYQASNCFGNR